MDRPVSLDAPEATARTDLKDHLDRLAQLAAMDKTARQVHVEKMVAWSPDKRDLPANLALQERTARPETQDNRVTLERTVLPDQPVLPANPELPVAQESPVDPDLPETLAATDPPVLASTARRLVWLQDTKQRHPESRTIDGGYHPSSRIIDVRWAAQSIKLIFIYGFHLPLIPPGFIFS
jgi:hypothetical protein